MINDSLHLYWKNFTKNWLNAQPTKHVIYLKTGFTILDQNSIAQGNFNRLNYVIFKDLFLLFLQG
jgi:hypothetical protein